MSKKRSMAALIMALSMALPFAGCKKNDTSDTTSRSASPVSGATAAKATDPYFDAGITSLVMPTDPDRKVLTNSIASASFIGDMILAEYYQEYESPDTTLEFMTDDDSYVQGMALFDLKGNLVKTLHSDWRVLSASASKDGTMWLLESSVASQNENYVRAIPMKEDGSEDTSREVRFPAPAADYIEVGFLKITEEGLFVVALGGDMTVYDQNGQKKYSITDGSRQVLENLYEVDGKKYIVSVQYDVSENSFSTMTYVREMDIQTGKFLSEKELSSFLSNGYPMPARDGAYVTSDQGIFKADLAKGEMNQVFDWNDTDVNLSMLVDCKCQPVSENEFYVLGSDMHDTSDGSVGKSLIHLTRADTNPHAGKTLVTVGALNTNERFLDFMYEYNTDHSHKYKIVMVSYSDAPDDEQDNLESRILLDLMSTTPPDILLNFNDGITFSDENTMADLNEFMDGPNGIDRSLFFDNIFRSMERGGKLFHIPLTFGMEGFVANPAYISKRTGWTFDEFESVARSLPQDVTFLSDITKIQFLRCLVSMSLDKFVDGKNKTVDFNNETFKKYLEISKTYGCESTDQDDSGYVFTADGSFLSSSESISVATKFNEGMLAMFHEDVSGFYDYWNLMRGSTGKEKPFLIGFPNSNGEGLRVSPTCTAGITQECKQKDAAWDVLRSYLLYDSMAKTPGVVLQAFSVSRKELRASCVNVQSYYNTIADEDAKYLEKGFLSSDKVTRRVEDADIEEFLQIVENINCSASYDETIMEIIVEETLGYFAGSRTAEDVMKNIQSRVNLVIQEK